MVVLGPSMENWCPNQRSQKWPKSVDDTFKGIIHRLGKTWPLVFKPIFLIEAVVASLPNFARPLLSVWTNFDSELSRCEPSGAEFLCSDLCSLRAPHVAYRASIPNPLCKSLGRERNFGVVRKKISSNFSRTLEMLPQKNARHNFRQISTLNFQFCVFAFSVIKNGFWPLWSKVGTPR